MKSIIVTLIIFTTCNCDAVINKISLLKQTKTNYSMVFQNKINPLDSLIIIHKLASQPFHKDDNMIYFNSIIKKSNKTKVKKSKGEYSEVGGPKTDVMKTIYWGKSFIQTKNDILQLVVIKDNNLNLTTDIKIGDKTSKVFEKLNIKYDNTKSYKYIELTTDPAEGAYNGLIFYFEKDTLVQINYDPYTG
jgi:hypothetical protein